MSRYLYYSKMDELWTNYNTGHLDVYESTFHGIILGGRKAFIIQRLFLIPTFFNKQFSSKDPFIIELLSLLF